MVHTHGTQLPYYNYAPTGVTGPGSERNHTNNGARNYHPSPRGTVTPRWATNRHVTLYGSVSTMPGTHRPAATNASQAATTTAEEWRIVPTTRHPDPEVDGPYPCSPGPSAGLTKQAALALVNGRNHAGEPSPEVTWSAEPTGRTKPVSELQGK